MIHKANIRSHQHTLKNTLKNDNTNQARDYHKKQQKGVSWAKEEETESAWSSILI